MVRDYLEQAVPPEVLERILQASLKGPSAGNSQGVSWVVLQSEQRRQAVAELAREREWVARGYPAWLSQAPVHLVLCAEPDVYQARYAEADKAQTQSWNIPYWYLDAGCTMMLVLLAAQEEGLAAGFQGEHNLPGLASLCGLPQEVKAIGVVTLGYAASHRAGHSARRPKRAERIHWEQW